MTNRDQKNIVVPNKLSAFRRQMILMIVTVLVMAMGISHDSSCPFKACFNPPVVTHAVDKILSDRPAGWCHLARVLWTSG